MSAVPPLAPPPRRAVSPAHNADAALPAHSADPALPGHSADGALPADAAVPADPADGALPAHNSGVTNAETAAREALPRVSAGLAAAAPRALAIDPELCAVDAAEAERNARPRPTEPHLAALWDTAATVVDPEVPVLTIEDLGILRGVRLDGDIAVVKITPTYSGCPAVEAIRADIVAALAVDGIPAAVEVVFAPAWTTDWMSEEGRRKLLAFGIAPPRPRGTDGMVSIGLGINCPLCGSLHTREMSRFGSTACKALWQCQNCGEPFDRFKEL